MPPLHIFSVALVAATLFLPMNPGLSVAAPVDASAGIERYTEVVPSSLLLAQNVNQITLPAGENPSAIFSHIRKYLSQKGLRMLDARKSRTGDPNTYRVKAIDSSGNVSRFKINIQ